MRQPERLARAAEVLVKAGVISLERPGTALGVAKELLGWKMTPATN